TPSRASHPSPARAGSDLRRPRIRARAPVHRRRVSWPPLCRVRSSRNASLTRAGTTGTGHERDRHGGACASRGVARKTPALCLPRLQRSDRGFEGTRRADTSTFRTAQSTPRGRLWRSYRLQPRGPCSNGSWQTRRARAVSSHPEYKRRESARLEYAARDSLSRFGVGWRAAHASLLLLAAVPAALAQSKPPTAQPPTVSSAGAEGDIVVVTASRREEQLLNAPATMTVLTEDVLATAPGQSVTDLLRLVPGLNTIQTSARDVNVTSRGATSTLSDSMLVLVDGRSIYQDFFGSVLWDFLPVDTTEIKQIEVIRGPASAVWGANAMTGVVNVVSKTPREMQGTTVSIRFGQFDRSPPDGAFDGGGLFSISATHAEATNERFAYKVSGGWL